MFSHLCVGANLQGALTAGPTVMVDVRITVDVRIEVRIGHEVRIGLIYETSPILEIGILFSMFLHFTVDILKYS